MTTIKQLGVSTITGLGQISLNRVHWLLSFLSYIEQCTVLVSVMIEC